MVVYCQRKIDIEKEKAAIIAVIEQETNAYIGRDYECWKAVCVQNDPFVRFDGTVTQGFGAVPNWEIYDSIWYANYKNSPEPLTTIIKKENYNIRVTPEAAWAIFLENFFDSEGTQTGYNISTRFLEKQNGEWKISVVQLYIPEFEQLSVEGEGQSETEDIE